LVLVFFHWNGIEAIGLLGWLELPPDWVELAQKPWTMITYLFVHMDFMHLLINMLLLYFFGSFLSRWVKPSRFFVHFVAGGISGGFFFLLAHEWPSLIGAEHMQEGLLGASASLMALCLAVACYKPNESVRLFLLGKVKIKYIVLLLIVLDLAGIGPEAVGATIAHFGGGLYGLLVGIGLRRGKDLATWIDRFILFFSRPASGSRKKEIKYKRPLRETINRMADIDQQYLDQKKEKTEQLDKILDKIKQSGYSSLTQEEKDQLFEFSQKS